HRADVHGAGLPLDDRVLPRGRADPAAGRGHRGPRDREAGRAAGRHHHRALRRAHPHRDRSTAAGGGPVSAYALPDERARTSTRRLKSVRLGPVSFRLNVRTLGLIGIASVVLVLFSSWALTL